MATSLPLGLARALPKLIDVNGLSKPVTAEDQQLVTRTIREWTYDHVSASASGNYCQVLFDKSKDNDEINGTN